MNGNLSTPGSEALGMTLIRVSLSFSVKWEEQLPRGICGAEIIASQAQCPTYNTHINTCDPVIFSLKEEPVN